MRKITPKKSAADESFGNYLEKMTGRRKCGVASSATPGNCVQNFCNLFVICPENATLYDLNRRQI